MNKRILITASLFGATAVILGAFGAHGLKSLITTESLDIWAKGVEYQFYHTFALLFLFLFTAGRESKYIKIAYGFFTLGVVLFSGSLYLLAIGTILNVDFVNFIGPVTPVGGLLLIGGWFVVFLEAIKRNNA